jgi:hypothetical protein
MTDKYEEQMVALGFVYTGSGEYLLESDGARYWVWKTPARSIDGWLEPYPPGTWVADLGLSTDDLRDGKGVAFDDPVSAGVYIITACGPRTNPEAVGDCLPEAPFAVN